MDRAALVDAARESIARGSKSFAAASTLFDPAVRERAWLLYAWCRRCDDLVDGQDHGHDRVMVHDARVVRMNGTHPPASLRKWFGDSIGRWEGDTLVVESNGFNDRTGLHSEGLVHTDRLRVTERYRRTDFGFTATSSATSSFGFASSAAPTDSSIAAVAPNRAG